MSTATGAYRCGTCGYECDSQDKFNHLDPRKPHPQWCDNVDMVPNGPQEQEPQPECNPIKWREWL